MKKRFLVMAVLLMAVVGGVSAQMFSMGVKLGYNVTLEREQVFSSTVDQLFDVRGNIQNGFHAGVYARIGRRLYAQPEVNYNYYTYNSAIKNNGTLVDKKYTISTVDVPVLVGFSIINSNFFKLRVMAGPRFSFNAGSTKASSWDAFSESVRDTRVGLDCGVGVDIWRFNLDVRYNLFSDIYKRQTVEGDVLKSKPLNQFEVSLGFRIFGQNTNN